MLWRIYEGKISTNYIVIAFSKGINPCYLKPAGIFLFVINAEEGAVEAGNVEGAFDLGGLQAHVARGPPMRDLFKRRAQPRHDGVGDFIKKHVL